MQEKWQAGSRSTFSEKRDAKPMKVLLKTLVRLEYSCTLTAPIKSGETADPETVERSFSARFYSISHLNYWECLQFLKRKRCIIICTSKILEGLVPNLHKEMTPYEISRYGRKCKIALLDNKRFKRYMLWDNFLYIKSPRLFNIHPLYITGITN